MTTATARPLLSRFKIPYKTLALVALLGAGGAWWWSQQQNAATPAGETFTVARGEVRQTAEATGRIEPHVQVEVKSRASGEIIEVLVEEGDVVEAGQVLFRLDARDAERALEDAQVTLRRVTADVGQSRANISVAQAQAEEAEAARSLSERAAERGLASAESTRSATSTAQVATATVTLRQAALRASQATLAAARLAVQDAEQRLAEMTIAAPVAGTVLDVTVERGSIVASAISNVSGGTALATVADLSDLRVVGSIDEAQIGRVEPGQEVEIRVDAYPDRTFAGQVERVAPLGVEEANIVTFDVEIVVRDEQASLLRSGMSADLSILTGLEEGVLVPLAAVRTEGRSRVVQLASGETRRIRSGATDGRRLVVLQGLEDGDEVRAVPSADAPVAATTMSLMPGGGGRRGGGGGMR